jgi:hypothetical protein
MIMKEFPALPPCFCITGHGRSGTSFLTEMLQSAGLEVGRRLMGPGEANRRGHFEDMDFHELHVAMLRSQGFGFEGFIVEPSVRVEEQFLPPAHALVESRRRDGKPWGWKEPRSTLFLDFWSEMVPELGFLLLFRRPWEVIDSLFRRGDSIYQEDPRLAVQVWLNYNRTVLDFLGRHPGRCLLIESYAVALEPRRLTEAISAKFGVRLGTIGEGVYEDDLFRREDTSRQRSILDHFFPEAIALYEQLRSRADVAPEPTEAVAVEEPVDLDWTLRYWLDFRRLEAEENRASRQLQRELEATRGQLRLELEEARGQLRQSQADLERLRHEVAGAEYLRAALTRSESERDEARARLAESEDARTRSEECLGRVRAHLAWVESSKFWRLRRLWVRLRTSLRRTPRPSESPDPGMNSCGSAPDPRPGAFRTESRLRDSRRAVRRDPGRPTRP